MKRLFIIVALTLTGAATAAPAPASDGSIVIEGQRVDYRAEADTVIVHPKGWSGPVDEPSAQPHDDSGPAFASVFYVAYFRKGVTAQRRPLTFVYNGGPGSPSMWLHMGSFGPQRVVLQDGARTLAPYDLRNNPYSLLDVTDLVFIDAPGTGFSRTGGRAKDPAFYGLDADAHAFAEVINSLLARYERWKSPKYLFGESYGTARSALLVDLLQNDYGIDVSGLILLSNIMNFDLSPERVRYNPGTDQAYITALPSYAAVAWYHNRLPGARPPDLETFLHQVEHFALTDYAVALQAGATLDAERRVAIARQIAAFTGLPQEYVLRCDLRVDAGQFRKMLLDDESLTLGMTDARFTGPSMDPLSREAGYLPELSAITGPFVAGVNDYLRNTLGYGGTAPYLNADLDPVWEWRRDQPANAPTRIFGVVNVLPDLARAMKYNPALKVMLNGGYFDLGTPYFAGEYEMHHLPIPLALQKNIEYHYYQAGHMPYLHEPALKQMRANVAEFIRRTDNLP